MAWLSIEYVVKCRLRAQHNPGMPGPGRPVRLLGYSCRAGGVAGGAARDPKRSSHTNEGLLLTNSVSRPAAAENEETIA